MQREFTYGIMMSSGNYKKPPDKFSMFPLPYDDEIERGFSGDEMEDMIKEYESYKGLI